MNNIKCKGSAYEIGFQRGFMMKQAGIFVKELCEQGCDAKRYAYAQACEASYQTYDPSLITEIKGLCDALAYPYDKMRTFLFGMYAMSTDAFCSSIALCYEGQAMLGRNSDFLKKIAPYTLHENIQSDDAFAYYGNTTAFMELEDGMNEHGLAVGLTFVRPHMVKPGYQAGLLVRHLLAHCTCVEDAIKQCKLLPIGSAQTLTLADRYGKIAMIECNCETIQVERNDVAVYAVNLFQLANMLPYRLSETIDDLRASERLRTIKQALASHKVHDFMFLQQLLKGTYGFICQYPDWCPADTIWSAIYLPKTKTSYLCDGNPQFHSYHQLDEK